ncbi:hypothetical protein [Brachybacterium fresconis]|uniref:Uncharacterized protein n=1 Tax=Brachybacterium fresconis TaxID=173363 RepID=A0ABS4YNZ6_9MICO|nr:hypothetical protein [Brachybacterium fresconis]MBP2410127.1 hypothetical protein [Brachybacterium fresconis]
MEDLGEVVVLDRHQTRSGDPIGPAETTPLDHSSFEALHETTERNLAWISELTSRGKHGSWFHGTPQVLTSNPVRLTNAEVIDWSTANAPGSWSDLDPHLNVGTTRTYSK